MKRLPEPAPGCARRPGLRSALLAGARTPFACGSLRARLRRACAHCARGLRPRLPALLGALLACAGCTGDAPEPAAPALEEDGRGPQAFRSVLDGRPRMLTLALGEDLWVAYEVSSGALYKVWRDGVDFEGAVYDTHHGPQPTSRGPAWWVSPQRRPWRVLREGGEEQPRVRYRGHRLQDGHATLSYALHLADGTVLGVAETPRHVEDAAGRPGLERSFATGGVPEGVRLALALHLGSLRSPDGVEADGGTLEGVASGPDGSLEARLLLRSNGATRLTTWLASEPGVPAEPDAAPAEEPLGQALIEASDCRVCHDPELTTTGPALRAIAQRYPPTRSNVERLARKVIGGGSGAWGQAAMTPHPSLSDADAREMVHFILTLDGQVEVPESVLQRALGFASAARYEVALRGGAALARAGIGSDAPGDRRPLEAVHPGFDLEPLRPPGFEPRVGGLGFLSDGRLAVSTWDASGSVYLLSHVVGGDPRRIEVKRIAQGLAEPLGLAVVDDEIYVLQKQELTRLRDLDGDEIIDAYETLSDAWTASANFHEFAFGLVYRDGWFYATLATAIEPGGASAKTQLPDRGKVIRISRRDGSVEFVAHGLRAPNGIGFGAGGEIFVSDNQGDWLPSSKIVHLEPGAFYGSRAVDPQGTADLPVTPPVVWLPQDEIGNSPSQPAPLDVGPYTGQMIHGDVTHGGLKRVFAEQVQGAWQGAVFRFSQGLEAGVNRICWGPDGKLYVGGIGNPGNWGQQGKRWFGLERLAWAGRPVFEMLAVRARSDGLEIELSEPLAAGLGGGAGDYEVEQWRYEPTADYGGPKLDARALAIRTVRVSPDRRRVFLGLEGLAAGHVVYLRLKRPRFRSDGGRQLWTTEAWYTLNRIPPDRAGPSFGSGPARAGTS